MAYLLDADVFIRAKNLHYGFDFCPAFWEWLVEANATERLFRVEKVGDEVQAVEDELSAWAATRATGFFLRPDAPPCFLRWPQSASGPQVNATNLPP